MILKRQSYDAQHRLVTNWSPGVTFASRLYDDDWQSDVIELRYADPPTTERVLLDRGEGVYLCNDEGRTIEVLSRLPGGAARSKPQNPKEN